MFGNRPYLEGASTITQQLARNFFSQRKWRSNAEPPAVVRRKLQEQFMAVIPDLRATKDEVLGAY